MAPEQSDKCGGYEIRTYHRRDNRAADLPKESAGKTVRRVRDNGVAIMSLTGGIVGRDGVMSVWRLIIVHVI